MQRSFFVKRSLITAGMISAGVLAAVSLAQTNHVEAATNVQADQEIATVTYQGPGKVRLLDSQGVYQNQYLAGGTRWKTFAKGTIKDRTMYRLGSDQQWIPAAYTNLSAAPLDNSAADQSSQQANQTSGNQTSQNNGQTNNSQANQNNQTSNQTGQTNSDQTPTVHQAISQRQKVSGVVQVNYQGPGQVRLVNESGDFVNQYVKNNTIWKAFEKAMINDQVMYRIGSSQQWLPAKFTLGLVPKTGYSSAWTYPIAGFYESGNLTSSFGSHADRNWHDGIDIIPDHGGNEDIRAIHGGTVYFIGHEGTTQNDLGYYICIKSPDGYNTVYQEFAFYEDEAQAAIHVKVGDVVKPGQVILTFIPTTHVTHVHIGVTQSEVNAAEKYWNSDNGTWIDPMQLIYRYNRGY
jgi:murein DD-endopeptidase MepM/ murein hydrolase activator NlpD